MSMAPLPASKPVVAVASKLVQWQPWLWARLSPQFPLLIFAFPAFLAFWSIERWLFPSSNWVPVLFAVWAIIKFGRHKRRALIEEMNNRRKWRTQNTFPLTPLEPCEWLNKLIMSIWPNYMEPKLSHKLSAMLLKRIKAKLPGIFDNIELQEFSLGLAPPVLGLQCKYWTTEGSEQVLHTGFDWDTNEMSILLAARLAGPIKRLARVNINSLHVKGDLRILPILDGHSLLYSFESPPEIRIGIALGGDAEAYPSIELPGIATCVEKAMLSILSKTMIEPNRSCFSFSAVDMKKHVSGAIVAITVISATNLGALSKRHERTFMGFGSSGVEAELVEQTFKGRLVEVRLDGVTRQTHFCGDETSQWDETFEMIADGSTSSIYFNVYEQDLTTSMDLRSIGRCKVKMKYVQDDSTVFWAIGRDGSALAAKAEHCGKEVIMEIPLEGSDSAKIVVKLVVNTWHYSEARTSGFSQLSNFQATTGRILKVTVEEGKNLAAKDKSGNSDPYVLLRYGKTVRKTRMVPQNLNPSWNQTFEFAELSGEDYLKLKCYDADFIFDDSLGSARVNLEGLQDDESRDIWVPLGNMDTGEIRLIIKAMKSHSKHSRNKEASFGNGMLELVLLEARDLVAADLRGTSDPFVSVHYGKQKKRTKVVYKTLHPHWNQTLEFPDDGQKLELFVKDHNTVLPTSSIGHCVVVYQNIQHNQPIDMWIPLQGVKKGEMHIRITRLLHPAIKAPTKGVSTSNTWLSDMSSKSSSIVKEAHQLAEEGEFEQLASKIDELVSLEEEQDRYVLQLIEEKNLLLSKIDELERSMGDLS